MKSAVVHTCVVLFTFLAHAEDDTRCFSDPSSLYEVQEKQAKFVAIADVDSDGSLDVVVYDDKVGVVWYENADGMGTFVLDEYRLIYNDSAFPNSRMMRVADINNDGAVDVLVVRRTLFLSIIILCSCMYVCLQLLM